MTKTWKSFGVFTNGRKLSKAQYKLAKGGYETREKEVTLLEARKLPKRKGVK